MKYKLHSRKPKPWYTKLHLDEWRTYAAIVYLVICVFDFIVVPVWIGVHNEKLTTLIADIKDLTPAVQTIILNHRLDQWQPLTLNAGGLFHMAFGAILGVSAWSRGREIINGMRASNSNGYGQRHYGAHDDGYGGPGPGGGNANNVNVNVTSDGN